MPHSKSTHYDICIIGAGSAGLSIAAAMSQLGLRTALVEKNKMGGDCLNTGCVPSKALLQAAKTAQNFRTSAPFGITPQEPEVDFAAVKDHVAQTIATIEPNDSPERFEKLGVTVIQGTAVFTGDSTLIIDDSQTISADYFVVATGSRAAIPPIQGLDKNKILTNENLFDLREKPEHLVIIGGGPIGIEMAQAHRRLGCRVTVLDIGNILPKDDPELVSILTTELEKEGITFLQHIKVNNVTHTDSGVTVSVTDNGKTFDLQGSHLLVAAGRQPNTEGLNLEKAGVDFDKAGIKTDARLRTTNKKIFAAGDVAGGPQFTHIAGYHAGIIVRNIAFKIPAKVNYDALPWVTYTDPELAHVGMTEAMAIKKYGADKVGTTSWDLAENDRAIAERKTAGRIKVIALKNGKILGASILAPSAGEMIGMWGVAIQKKMKLSDIAGMIAPYPTLSEISKRAAGAWYTPKLFSNTTKAIVRILKKWPF